VTAGAGSAEYLAKSKQDLNETLSPIFDAIDNVVNNGLGKVIEVLTTTLKSVTYIAAKVGLIADKDITDDDDSVIKLTDWIEDSIHETYKENTSV
jgi:ferritin